MKIKTMMALAMTMLIAVTTSSCCKDCDCDGFVTTTNNFAFRTVNLSSTGETPLSAASGSIIVNTTVTVSITVNGETKKTTMSKSSNELPVVPGCEIEVSYDLKDASDASASFALPDGTNLNLNGASNSFKWTVPQSVKDGDKIEGECQYKIQKGKYHESGFIILKLID